MNKLSKEKRDRLLLISIGSLGIIALLYFFVITDQKNETQDLKIKTIALRGKREASERQSKRGSQVQSELDVQKKLLEERQVDMPRPDQDHVWFLNIMEERRRKYNLDLVDIKNPEPTDAGVLPKFPFKAVALNVTMIGDYYDFGRFLADFENSYPYMRVQMISITPEFRTMPTSARPGTSALTVSETTDKVRFNYRVIALIKSPL